MRDYKCLYHNPFGVKKNWHGKRVDLWSCICERNTIRSCKINLIHCYKDIIHQHPHSSLYFHILITSWDVHMERMHRQHAMCQYGLYFQKHYWTPSVNDHLHSLSTKLQLYRYCTVRLNNPVYRNKCSDVSTQSLFTAHSAVKLLSL